ncbi:MAG: ThiF family adenylyltransferase [Pirellulales bacterium]|nr:ThiF family adenylyltransferase [Pirellulales bacterium]
MSDSPENTPNQVAPGQTHPSWDYDEAFSRQRGLIDTEEQERLRRSRVAIVGMGGVGGVHLITLARAGVGAFCIADPDTFEVANFNRQYGASLQNVGRNKAAAMAREALDINPELDLRVFETAIDAGNIGEFLDGADVFIDGMDFFNIEARRLLFKEARRRGIWAVTAGPIGFSTAWLTFDPNGMTFDEYFNLNDQMDRLDQLIAFAVGLTPRMTHLPYMDLREVSIQDKTGPSASLACQLASGVAAAETLKMLLGRRPIRAVPWYSQFDAYRQILRHGRLRGGNRHPWQRFKRWWMHRKFSTPEST